MIIAKVFAERDVTRSYTDLVFGILIIEDLAAKGYREARFVALLAEARSPP